MDFDPKEIEQYLEMLRKLINAKEAVSREDVKNIIKKIVPTFIETEDHTKKVEATMAGSKKEEYVVTLDNKKNIKKIEHKKNKKKVAK